jgi:molecular chaperone GrpE
MDAELKEQLIGRFRQYLDNSAAEDSAPPPASGEMDLFTLFTELAALKNEVKLESRQVRQALDHSRELIDALRENNQQFSDELARRRQEQDEVRLAAERPLLLEILELRDRIEVAREGLQGYRPGLMTGRRTKQYLSAVAEGMEISLRRLDGLLAGYQVRALDAVGKRIKPESMQVTAIQHRHDREDGVVLEEVRKGFLRAGQVLRPAEVIVNKRQTPL